MVRNLDRESRERSRVLAEGAQADPGQAGRCPGEADGPDQQTARLKGKMMDRKTNTHLSAHEREELFADSFDFGTDASVTLARLVRAAGDYLQRIVGKERANAGMTALLEPLVSGDPEKWREDLEENEIDCFSTWPLGTLLHDLAAYAHFGIFLDPMGETAPEDVEERLGQMVGDACAFLDQSPLHFWSISSEAPQLEALIALARNRWALDQGEAVEPWALASFGGVTEARIRNMMAGRDSYFENRDGKVPAAQALRWLEGRPNFMNSIWRDRRQDSAVLTATLTEPVFVPVARDGSFFHPGLGKSSGFTVGPKGDERQFADFHTALGELQRMPVPFWRRPNEKGAWGIVRGVSWERRDLSALPEPSRGERDG